MNVPAHVIQGASNHKQIEQSKTSTPNKPPLLTLKNLEFRQSTNKSITLSPSSLSSSLTSNSSSMPQNTFVARVISKGVNNLQLALAQSSKQHPLGVHMKSKSPISATETDSRLKMQFGSTTQTFTSVEKPQIAISKASNNPIVTSSGYTGNLKII